LRGHNWELEVLGFLNKRGIMKKIIDTFRRLFFCLVLLGGFSPTVFGGDTGNIKITPYITIQEEYNDNINLTSKTPKSDWISSMYPGVKFSSQDSHYAIDLDYKLGLILFASNPENNNISHSGKLNTYYKLNPQWTLRLKEDFLHSEDTQEVDPLTSTIENQSYYSTNQNRAAFLRNVVEPSLEYQFGKEDLIAFTYRNTIYRTQNPLSQDSQESAFKASLATWFNIKNGILLDYSFSKGVFAQSPDLRSHLSKVRYTYRPNPTTSFYVDYTFQKYDFDYPGIDYMVHNPSFGIDHAFTSTLNSTVQAGYFLKNANNSTTNGYTYLVSLVRRDQKTTYTFSLQGGYTQDYFTSQNLGFTRYNRAYGKISHQIMEKLSLNFTGLLERAEFDANRTDWIWGGTGGASYQVLKWLTLALEASHREDNSTIDFNSYNDNRAILKITATY
jgi:hypothetical protein